MPPLAGRTTPTAMKQRFDPEQEVLECNISKIRLTQVVVGESTGQAFLYGSLPKGPQLRQLVTNMEAEPQPVDKLAATLEKDPKEEP